MVPDAAVTNWKIGKNCIAFFAKFETADAGTDELLSRCSKFCETDSGVPAYEKALCSKSPFMPLCTHLRKQQAVS